MNYIKKMARGCCSCQNSEASIQSVLIDMVSRKLGELTGDLDNPLNLTEAARIISEKLDEIQDCNCDPEDVEYASDSDIVDLFNN
jgi:hypothetical protein